MGSTSEVVGHTSVPALEDVGQNISSAFKNIRSTISSAVERVGHTNVSALENVGQNISSAFKNVGNTISSDVGRVGTNFPALKNVGQNISFAFKNVGNTISSYVGRVGTNFPALKNVGNTISSASNVERVGGECAVHLLSNIVVGALWGLVAVPLCFLSLALLGFGTGGIVYGSCAAACQSGIGNVVAGSCFSMAQQAGMIGLKAYIAWPFMVASSLVGIIVAIGVLALNGEFPCVST